MRICHSIELAAPVPIVYELFRQPEELSRILRSVVEVTPDEPNGIRYRLLLEKSDEIRLDAELVEATRYRRIAWKHLHGPIESGRIEFVPVNPETTRLDVELVQREGDDSADLEPVWRNVGAELRTLQRLLAGIARQGPRRWDEPSAVR
jgi:uncharacterized membrane protein